jgi:D-amino-acid dehydrogenase
VAEFDVAVVGGGLVGTATAYELGARGVRTLLVDRADPGRATDAGAGILSPETTERDERGWRELVRAAGAHYDALIPRLTGDTGWARCGILQLATRPSDVPPWEWVAERATGGREISGDEARALVPVLGEVVRALYHPAAARVDGRKMCAALRQAAIDEHGVEVRTESVADVHALPADAVVIAGGAWTDEIASALGVPLPVGPVRGQIIHLGVDGHDTGAWPVVQPVFGYYMVPWADARVAVGATVEDAGFATDVTAGGVHEVLRETLRVMPGLASATVREVRVGLRPASADDFPIIGALPGVPSVFVATGHGANGLLLGPVSGALVADLVCGRDPIVDLAPFDPARFSVRA